MVWKKIFCWFIMYLSIIISLGQQVGIEVWMSYSMCEWVSMNVLQNDSDFVLHPEFNGGKFNQTDLFLTLCHIRNKSNWSFKWCDTYLLNVMPIQCESPEFSTIKFWHVFYTKQSHCHFVTHSHSLIHTYCNSFKLQFLLVAPGK